MTRGEVILESLMSGDYLTAREVIGTALAEESTDYIQHVAESIQLEDGGYDLQDLSEELIGDYFGLNEDEDDELADMSRDLVEEYLIEMPVVRGSARYHDKREAIDPFRSNKDRYKDFDRARKNFNDPKASANTRANGNHVMRDMIKDIKARKKAGKWDRVTGHQNTGRDR